MEEMLQGLHLAGILLESGLRRRFKVTFAPLTVASLDRWEKESILVEPSDLNDTFRLTTTK